MPVRSVPAPLKQGTRHGTANPRVSFADIAGRDWRLACRARETLARQLGIIRGTVHHCHLPGRETRCVLCKRLSCRGTVSQYANAAMANLAAKTVSFSL